MHVNGLHAPPSLAPGGPSWGFTSTAGSAFEALLGAGVAGESASASAGQTDQAARAAKRPRAQLSFSGQGASKPPAPAAKEEPAPELAPAPLGSDAKPPQAPARPDWPFLLNHGCRSVERYRKLNRIDEGTYGVVYRARDAETGEVLALKQLKLNAAKSDEGFPMASLREVTLLTTLDHPNVIRLHEVVIGASPLHIFMVMEYCEHELRTLVSRHTFSVAEIKCLMKQLCSALAHLHANWVIHRDLKTSNLLLTNRGVLKVCDFGLARHYGDPCRIYSHNVITLWYRAPELIMGQKRYTTSADIWSVGCIMAELFLRTPLFEGKSELHQLTLIYELTGVPTEESWPGYEVLPNRKRFSLKLSLPRWRDAFPEELISDMGLELVRSLLTCCPERRCTAEAAGEDPYFWERPHALEPAMMPTYTDTNSRGRERRPPAIRRVSSLENSLELAKRT